ncbi:MAG: hypothetical protein SGILL_004416 [Bacillariaceae sp.]
MTVHTCIERVVDVPVDRAWEILSDFSHVHRIHPIVETVDQKTVEGRGLGAIRQCNMYDGNFAKERIVEWDEANRKYKVEVIDSSLPVKKLLAILSVTPSGSDKSKLSIELNIKAKYGLLGKIMERLVMKRQLGGTIGDLLGGVEEYEKTGIEIQKGFQAKTRAMVTC